MERIKVMEELVKHICLGQWELAFLLAKIATDFPSSETSLEDVAEVIAYKPQSVCLYKEQCNEWSWHFSQLLTKQSDLDNDNICNEVEFRLILQNSTFLEAEILREIHKMYCEILEEKKEGEELSSDCLEALLNHLLQQPFACSSLIVKIITIAKERNNLPRVFSLVKLFFETLERLLKRLKNVDRKEKSNINENLERTSACLLNVLSEDFVDQNERAFFQSSLKSVLENFVALTRNKLFSKKTLYSSLIGREKSTLLKIYELAEDDLNGRTPEWNAVTRGSLFGGIFNDGMIDFNEVFLQMVKSKTHFLDGIMNSSVDHILNGRVSLVLKCFTGSWFSHLLPLIVSRSWKECETDREASNVLSVIADMNVETTDEVVKNMVVLMKCNLEVTNWCVSKWRDINFVSENIEILSKKRNIFSTLQINSPLCAIHKFVGLRNLDGGDDVLKLLGGKIEYETESGNQVLIFCGYLVLSYVMDAIYYSTQLDQFGGQSVKNKVECDDHQMSFSKEAELRSFMKTEGLQRAYEEFVTKNLEKAKTQLEKINLVALKVELMEDVFSLIFLNHNDFQSPAPSQDESDEGHVGVDMNSASENTPLRLKSLSQDNTIFQYQYSVENLKDSNSRTISDSYQGSTSHSSSGSSVSNSNLGFLCNETLLKDLISWLSDAYLDTKNAVYQEFGVVGVETTSEIGNSVCSVKRKEIQKRLSKLSVYITEAQWRFELLSNDTAKSGDVVVEKPNTPERQVSFMVNGKRKKKKKRKGSNLILSDSNRTQSLGIYQKMLASPEALLRYSLLNRNLEQASQVIQLFKLESSYDGVEAVFSKHLVELASKLSSSRSESRVKRTELIELAQDGSEVIPKMNGSVLSLVSSSLESANEISAVEKHFEDYPNPKLKEVDDLRALPDLANSHLAISLFNEGNETDLAVLADVAYSFGFSLDKIENILSFALRRTDLELPNGKPKKQIHTKGILSFSKQIHEYIEQILTNLKKEGDIFSPCYSFEKSRSKSLFFASGPLEAKSVRKNTELWKSFNYQCDLLSKMLAKEEETRVTLIVNEGRDSDLLHSAFFRLTKFNTQDLTSFPPDKRGIVNYLDTVFQHVKDVSSVLSKCGTGWVLRKSYFSVLDESPIGILSGLVLQNSVPLKELEAFAKQMHLDLVHVITLTCCPQIPNSVELRSMKTISLLQRSISEVQPDISDQSPEQISQALLQEILNIIKGDNVFDLRKALSLCHHQNVTAWMRKLSILMPKLDLTRLSTQEEKLAFYINLTNALWLHAIFTDFRNNTENFESLDGPVLRPASDYSPLLSPLASERILRQCHVKYDIGQLGSVSLFGLKYWLLIKDSFTPKYLEGSPLSHITSYINIESQKCKTFLPTIEPRCLFVINEGFISTPSIQILSSETVRQILDESMIKYLTFNVEVDSTSKLIRLPELLYWHYLVFACEDPKHSAVYEGLVTFIASNVESDLKEKITDLLKLDLTTQSDGQDARTLPFEVEIAPFDYQFGVTFDYSKPKTSLNGINNSTITAQKPTFNFDLPEHVLEYVSTSCPLVSDLMAITKEVAECKDITVFRDPDYFDRDISPYPLCEQLISGRSIQFLRGTNQDDKSWLEAYLSPKPNLKYIWSQNQACLDAKKFKLALENLELSNLVDFNVELRVFRDILLCHLASQTISLQFPDPWSYSLRISTDEFRTQTVLDCLKFWPDQACLETLRACLHSINQPDSSNLREILKLKIEELLSYKKAINILNRNEEFRSRVTTWQQVKHLADTDMESLIKGLESNPKILIDCVKIHKVPDHLKMFVAELHIVSLLEENPPNTSKVLEVLTEFNETLLDSLLERVKACSLKGRLFIVDYIIENYPNSILISNLKKLRIGLKMLGCISFGNQGNYRNLVERPLLIFEQLLMNVELETAYKTMEVIFEEPEDSECFTKEMINDCIEKYANSALEFSLVDASTDAADTVSLALSSGSRGDQFVMPATVPKKSDWTPDNAASICMVCCEENFSMFLRRHHCRRCGRVVSSNCSQNSMVVAGYHNIPVRVCDDCYEQTTHTSFFSPGTPSSMEKYPKTIAENFTYANSPSSKTLSRRRSSTIGSFKTTPWLLSCDEDDLEAVRDEFCYEQSPSVPLCLSILEIHNDPQRCAKYLLTLSDKLFTAITPRSSGKVNPEVDYSLVLSMMRMLLLSAKVKFLEAKDLDGVECYEVYNSLLDLVNLLIKNDCAHLIPTKGINSKDAVRRIRDRLLEEERMAISVMGDEGKFDSNFEFKQDRRQHSLALEVSTKFGLECSSVFASWGMVCLKAGDWISAREKFAYCLQKPKDLSKVQQENPLLKEIISNLETSSKGQYKSGTILSSLASLKSIQKGETKSKIKEEQNHVMIEECAYYLNKYGCHMSIVCFYQKHGMFTEALKYILEKSCDTDVFFNGLLTPSVKVAQLGVLLRQLQSNDASLEKWWPFLISTCVQLQQQNLFHVLHKIQIFMEDYIRSGMTSIRFYQMPARDYGTLFERLHHLTKARHNFEEYLKNKVNETNLKKKILKLPPPAVQAHIETLVLQTEITRYLHHCEENNILDLNLEEFEMEIVSSFPKERKPLCPPTLFDSKARKIALTVALLLLGLVEVEGLILGVKVIQAHQLDGDQICSILGPYVIKLNKTAEIVNLVNYLRMSPIKDKLNCDEMIQSCIQVLSLLPGKSREIETLVKLLTSDVSKINCYIMCNKLKSAYLLAIRLERVYDIKRIQQAALECGQDAVASICEKWLQHKERMPR